jgi:DNA-directed RNA polymerase subunit beta'
LIKLVKKFDSNLKEWKIEINKGMKLIEQKEKNNQSQLFELEKILGKLDNLQSSFDYLKINLASPTRIRSWSQRILPTGEIVGQITKPETINFRTHKPEPYGLFCEKTFGPMKNWKCFCGKYNGFGVAKICDECDVEIIEARVRRYRMGFINLITPIAHLWYLKGVPSYLCILLRYLNPLLKVSEIERIIYFKPKEEKKIIKTKKEKKEKEKDPFNAFKYYNLTTLKNLEENNELIELFRREKRERENKKKKRFGAALIKAALEELDLKSEIEKSRSLINRSYITNWNENCFPEKTLIRRIRILESFFSTNTNPSWIILTSLPVLPPTLRPLLELENGRLVAADLNEIYRLIITRNQRLFDFLFNCTAPDLITNQARKLLQESVDSLIDNARVSKEKKMTLNNKALKSLTEILEGKQGRFRQSLLGKRVDYSGRSVIVVGPNLRLNQCGLPYDMVKTLFQPFLINQLLKTKIKAPSHNTKLAKIIIKKNKPFVWSLLLALTKKYSVILNRAPTLHRFGIQAFDPILILGQAIHLHPLVCTGFNADFDGDQMAVHLPLYEASQLEIRTMMRPSANVLSPCNGDVILKPTQDMVIGCYYLTLMISKNKNIVQKWFGNENHVLSAFSNKKLNLHTPILLKYTNCSNLFSINNNKIKFLTFSLNHKNIFDNLKTKEIIVYKSFYSQKKKIYLITSIGVFISFKVNEFNENFELKINKNDIYQNDLYILTDFFLETTPGRLIFNKNFEMAIENK